MGLVEDVLYRYLYKEDVQTLARELGLSTSGTKEEIVDELLWSDRFDPSDALAFLNLAELRRLCREYRMPATGDRDELLDRIYEAIEQDRPPVVRRSAVGEQEDQEFQREHPDSTGPWAIASILAAALVGITLYATTSTLGTLGGILVTVVVAVALVVCLLVTAHRWVPWVARRIRSSPQD